jgi:hypothetical protein
MAASCLLLSAQLLNNGAVQRMCELRLHTISSAVTTVSTRYLEVQVALPRLPVGLKFLLHDTPHKWPPAPSALQVGVPKDTSGHFSHAGPQASTVVQLSTFPAAMQVGKNKSSHHLVVCDRRA